MIPLFMHWHLGEMALAAEDSAIERVNARYWRDIKPGGRLLLKSRLLSAMKAELLMLN